jgi:shikimate dehydrogenase
MPPQDNAKPATIPPITPITPATGEQRDAGVPCDRYLVVGNPVAHSQSPFIHTAFAAQTGQQLHYGRHCCPIDAFAAALQQLVAETADGLLRGCNVTVPFKFEALTLANKASERAKLAQAANVLRFDRDGWYADNTDGVGLLRDLQQNEGLTITGQRVLLLGAGGAACGVLGPLIEARPAELVVANRTPERAHALVARHESTAQAYAVRLTACGLQEPATQAGTASPWSAPFDLVINASAASLGGAVPDLSALSWGAGACAVDLMYGPAAQPFLLSARRSGAARAVDGLGMLVEQAAEAFALWRGVRPATAPVLAALRQRLAAEAASGGEGHDA